MAIAEKKKKILLAVTKSNWGGAQKYVFDIASAFYNTFDITVLVGGEGALAKKLSSLPVKVITMPDLVREISFFKEFEILKKLIAIFRTEKPDIVHLNSSKIGGLGSLAARILGIRKIIFTAHGWTFNEDRPSWQKIAIYFFVWLTGLFSHTIIVVSEKTKQDIYFLPFVRKKIVVIVHGIETPKFLSREIAQKKLFGKNIEEKNFSVGTIAELHKNKGIDISLQAIARLKGKIPVYYSVIGGGDEQKTLENMVKNGNLADCVKFLGEMKDAAIYLKAFDLFVLPSRTESLGYVILEAGLANLPVVAADVGGIPEIISSWNFGFLFPSEDSAKLSEAIRVLYYDKGIREEIGANLRARVEKEFSRESMIEKTKAVYLS